jgi:signal transduction histidine kinase/DNA-binding NarL/FixJ family response regulator
MKNVIIIFLLILGLCAPARATGADLVVARAVLEDPSGTLTMAQVPDQAFRPSGPTLTKGFTTSTFWLRLTVRKPDQGEDVTLAIRQPYLNEIRLYVPDPLHPGTWSTRVTGNHHPYAQRDRPGPYLGFAVRVQAPVTTYYLRLRTTTILQATVEALDPNEMERREDRFERLAVLFLTAMTLLLVWAVQSWLLDRLPVVGLFALHLATYTLYCAAVTGHLAPWLPSGFPRLADWATAVPYCAVTFTSLLFGRELLRPYEPPPWLMRGLTLLMLAFPLELAAMALGRTPFAVVLNLILVRVTWWYLAIMVFTLRREQAPSRRWLQALFLLITLLFTWFWLAGTSAMATRNVLFARQILVANGLVFGVLFSLILNARSRRLLLEARQSAQELQAKTEFLALVSHEIRTPLNALVGFSALARKATEPAALDQYLDIMAQASRSLLDLVNNILDLSKLGAHRLQCEAVPVDLRSLARSLEGEYLPLAQAKGLAWNLTVAAEVPAWGQGDPLRIRQILVNLLANAVKFTEKGEVSCAVTWLGAGPEPGARVRLEVRDTGIGITAAGLARLFQPFAQADPGISRRYGGTGLGLAIVHDLAGLMGGTVTAESEEGVGSRFTVELPFPEAAGPLPAAAATPALAVLVVEDQAFNRLLLEELLTAAGHHPTLAENGAQALALIEAQAFGLILLDIRMPDLDGFEVARRIRRLEADRQAPPVPILAVTADADAATREACLAVGIAGVLAKPVLPEQLTRAMADCCGPRVLSARTCADLGHEPERVRKYQELLLLDIQEELLCLEAALERDDRPGLGQAAHALKGLCGHLADPEPAAEAACLQQHAPASGTEALRPMVARLRKHWPAPGPGPSEGVRP